MGASSATESVWIVDITDKSNPKVMGKVPSNNYSDSDTLFFNLDYSLLATGNGSSVLLIDATNKLDLKQLSQFFITSDMRGTVEDVIITNDSLWIIATVRSYGLFVLDISNRLNMVLKFKLETFGGEGIVASAD